MELKAGDFTCCHSGDEAVSCSAPGSWRSTKW